METSCAVNNNCGHFEGPRISRIELQEAAKLLPKLLYSTSEDDEEIMISSPESDKECDEPAAAERRVVIATEEELWSRDGGICSASGSFPKDQTNPLTPSLFSSDVIPLQYKQAIRLVPDLSGLTAVEEEELDSLPATSVLHSTAADSIHENGSSIPKLPHITISQKRRDLPRRLFSNRTNQKNTHHAADLEAISPVYSIDNSQTHIPWQFWNVRHRIQHPQQNVSSSPPHQTYQYRSWSSSKRGPIARRAAGEVRPANGVRPAGGVRPGTQQLVITPVMNRIAMSYHLSSVSMQSNDQSLENPRTELRSHQLPVSNYKSLPVHFDYLKSTSRRHVSFRRRVPDEQRPRVVPSSAEEKRAGEETRQMIQRQATLLHLSEEKDKDYLVNFDFEEVDKKTKSLISKFRGGVVNTLDHLTEEIRDDYDKFLNEVDSVTYYAHRQAEELIKDYSPRLVVIISSAVPKAQMLQSATKPEVLSLVYDVAIETYTSLLDKLKALLNSYRTGAKAKCIAFVCKGGPGFMYLLQKKPITPAKLLKESELLRFWKEVGSCMSKISLTEPSVIHLMECNVAGNRQGTELLNNLEAAMFCHKVKALSPLELEPKGREMIATYFYPEKFKTWKSYRYSKVKLFK